MQNRESARSCRAESKELRGRIFGATRVRVCGVSSRQRNEWNPRPTRQEQKPRPSAAEAHSTGPKADASPDCTNRGRHVLSSLWWAVPSCQPDVSSWTAGRREALLEPLQTSPQDRERKNGRGQGGDRALQWILCSLPDCFPLLDRKREPLCPKRAPFCDFHKTSVTCWRLPCGRLSKTKLGPSVRAWGQERPTRQPAVEKRIGRRGLELFEYTQPWNPDVATHTHTEHGCSLKFQMRTLGSRTPPGCPALYHPKASWGL